MVAGSDRSEVVRTQRLELVDDQGRVQVVLETGEKGPTFTMFDPESGAPRLRLDGHPDGAQLRMFSPLVNSPLDGLLEISVHGDRSALCLHGIDGEGKSAFPSPRVQAESVTLDGPSGHVVVFDDSLDVVFEAPLTVESLQDRLRDRMIAAVADELTDDDVRRFDRGRILDAIDAAGDQVAGRFDRASRESATSGATAADASAG